MYHLDHASSYHCPNHEGVPGVAGVTYYDNVDKQTYGRLWFGCGCIVVRPLKVKRRKGEL
jgi:hypothetical protein